MTDETLALSFLYNDVEMYVYPTLHAVFYLIIYILYLTIGTAGLVGLKTA